MSNAAAILSPKTAQKMSRLQQDARSPTRRVQLNSMNLSAANGSPAPAAASQRGTSHLPPHIRAALAARHAARGTGGARRGAPTSPRSPRSDAGSPVSLSVPAAAMGRAQLRQTVQQRMAALSTRRRQQGVPTSPAQHVASSALPARPTAAVSSAIPAAAAAALREGSRSVPPAPHPAPPLILPTVPVDVLPTYIANQPPPHSPPLQFGSGGGSARFQAPHTSTRSRTDSGDSEGGGSLAEGPVVRSAAAPPLPLPQPSIAPGSEVERALAEAPKSNRKLHRPRVIKKMALGTKEYYKQKEEKLQGKAIHRQHQFYHLSYGMMVGIYTSVVSVPSGSKLSLNDFMEVRKLEFPPGGSPETQPHQLRETFKMKDYAPRVFHQLRERFGIDRKEYLSSLGGAYQYIEFHSNSKSGQFFFFSHDGKFMIKTQTAEESKFLRRILMHYFKHCAQNPGTYLPRFYGMHRLKMKHLGNRKVHFVVMHSVFDSGDLPIHTMFDLKGSTIGRAAKPEEKARGPGKVVLKDLDLMEDGVKLQLGARRRGAFLEQLRLDAAWLAAQQIMDYSLLLGIRDRHRPHVQGVKRQSVFVRADGGGGAAAGGGGGGLAHAAAAAMAELREEGEWHESDEDDVRRAETPRLGGLKLNKGGKRGYVDPTGDIGARHISAEVEYESSDDEAGKAGGYRGAGSAVHGGGVAGGGLIPIEDAAAAASSNLPKRIKTVMSFRGEVAPEDQFDAADLEYFPAACAAVPGWDNGRVAEQVYYIGIIDILQQYNFRKSGENLLRGLQYDRSQISAVDPKTYAERFVRFMDENSE